MVGDHNRRAAARKALCDGVTKRTTSTPIVLHIPQQFAIYANHRPNKHANAVLQWDHDRYLYGGQRGQSPRGQHVLILKDDIDPGVEITADYGPTFSYEAHGFSRHQESRPGSPQDTRRRVHSKESPRVHAIPPRRDQRKQ